MKNRYQPVDMQIAIDVVPIEIIDGESPKINLLGGFYIFTNTSTMTATTTFRLSKDYKEGYENDAAKDILLEALKRIEDICSLIGTDITIVSHHMLPFSKIDEVINGKFMDSTFLADYWEYHNSQFEEIFNTICNTHGTIKFHHIDYGYKLDRMNTKSISENTTIDDIINDIRSNIDKLAFSFQDQNDEEATLSYLHQLLELIVENIHQEPHYEVYDIEIEA